jgi:TRAP transporter TAXI family solute receptor
MPLRLGTAEPNSTFLSQGIALKAVLDRVAGLAPIDVLESPHASIDNANRLHAGEIELGFMAANWIGRARHGEPPFAGPIQLRMVAPMNAGPLFFIARADSALHTVDDLRGKRVAVGPEMSGMAQHARIILAALGLGFGDIRPVYLEFAAGADALVIGAVDAQLQCPIPNKVMSSLSERVPIRVLPFAPGQLERVLDAVPVYRRTVMRRGALRGLEADVAQPAVVNVLVTHARLPGPTVSEAVQAIVAAADELARMNPLFDGLADLFPPLQTQGAAAIEFGGVPLHPGARDGYRAAGLLR